MYEKMDGFDYTALRVVDLWFPETNGSSTGDAGQVGEIISPLGAIFHGATAGARTNIRTLAEQTPVVSGQFPVRLSQAQSLSPQV